MPKQFIARIAVSINIHQKDLEDILVGHNNDGLKYIIQDSTINNKKITCCERGQSNAPSTLIGDIDKNSKSSNVSSCEQVQRPSMVYNFYEERTNSDDLNDLDDGKKNEESK